MRRIYAKTGKGSGISKKKKTEEGKKKTSGQGASNPCLIQGGSESGGEETRKIRSRA
jgi:hypothetical protein